MSRKRVAFLCGSVSFAIFMWFYASMLNESEDGGPLFAAWYVMTAVISLIFALIASFLGYSIKDFIALKNGKWNELKFFSKIRSLIVIVAIFQVTLYVADGFYLTYFIKSAKSISNVEAQDFLDNSLYKRDKYALVELVQNPSLSAENLDKIARTSNIEIHDAISVMFDFRRLLEEYSPPIAILIIENENTSIETLTYLLKDSNGYVASTIVNRVLGDDNVKKDYFNQVMKFVISSPHYLSDGILESIIKDSRLEKGTKNKVSAILEKRSSNKSTSS